MDDMSITEFMIHISTLLHVIIIGFCLDVSNIGHKVDSEEQAIKNVQKIVPDVKKSKQGKHYLLFTYLYSCSCMFNRILNDSQFTNPNMRRSINLFD